MANRPRLPSVRAANRVGAAFDAMGQESGRGLGIDTSETFRQLEAQIPTFQALDSHAGARAKLEYVVERVTHGECLLVELSVGRLPPLVDALSFVPPHMYALIDNTLESAFDVQVVMSPKKPP